MPLSSLSHAKSSGNALFAILSLNVLQSLNEEKIKSLQSIGINSIGDLLHYKPLHIAQILMAIHRGEIGHDIELEHYLDAAYEGTSPSQLADLPIVAIEGIGNSTEEVFKESFGITSIREISIFPPFIEAQGYLTPDQEVFNESASAPEDLMPKILGNTSSIARYSNFVMDEELILGEGLNIPQSTIAEFSYSDLAKLFSTNKFRCFLGYIASYRQSWVNMGTHLGEIIHSLALAPGESRNIAVIEWYRRQSSARTEETLVDEQLTNKLVHTRALDEVTRVTAKEHQSGFTNSVNNTVSTANSENKGGFLGSALSTVGDLTAVVGFPLTIGSQTSASASSGSSSVYSNNSQVGTLQTNSSGNRDILGEMAQNITDSTLQNSSNIRSLWSTVIVTDEQLEEEKIQTRNITNYNHSHSLTIQYYEVVQKYCIKLALDNWIPIVYLPFKPLRFNLELIQKYWHLLKLPLQKFFPEKFEKFHPIISEPLNTNLNGVEEKNYKIRKIRITIAYNIKRLYEYDDPSLPIINPTFVPNRIYLILTSSSNPPLVANQSISQAVKDHQTNIDLDQIESLFISPIDSKFENAPLNPLEEIPLDITINYHLEDEKGDNQIVTKKYDKNISYAQLHQARVNEKPITLAENIGIEISTPSGEPLQSNISLLQEIEDHFNQTKYGYTRFLISALEKEQLIDIIENLYVGDDQSSFRLTEFIYPKSIAISDNFLIFKFNKKAKAESDNPFLPYLKKTETELKAFQKSSNICEDAFLPTAGVFAEAILGRSNASEFVNPRRFWNWQDSPIPHLAPRINTVQSGNHVINDNGDILNPNVPTSNLNIINPPQYALPTSLNAALQAVQNGNMFRDMSKSGELVSILGTLADLANNTAQISGNLTGQAAENALQGALGLGNQVAGMMHNASNILDRDTSSNIPPSPKTPTEKAAALNNLYEIKKKLSPGQPFSEFNKAQANIFGTSINPPVDPNFIPESIFTFLSNELEGFTELDRDMHGIGELHFNHFIGYFNSDEELDVIELTRKLYNRFDSIFSTINRAEAEKTGRLFNAKETIRFSLGGNLGGIKEKLGGLLHDDWVSVEMTNDSSSFYARTLKRNFFEISERLAIIAGKAFKIIIPGPVDDVIIEKSAKGLVEINQHHFLAGRRSWKIGFENENNRYFIETVAIERYSQAIHELGEDFLELKKNIAEIWMNLILNTAQDLMVEIKFPQSNYDKYIQNQYDFRNQVFIKMEDLTYSKNFSIPDWFKGLEEAHPGLFAV